MPKRKNYAESVYGHFYESGKYEIDPQYYASKSTKDAAPNKVVNDMFNPIVIEQRRTLPLTDYQIDNGGTNAALSMAYHKESPTVPTYGGGALLPEITVTPRGNYIVDSLHNHRLRRTLERRGGLVRFW
jgi:hypothetical protein